MYVSMDVYIQHTDHVAAATSSVYPVPRKWLKQFKQSVLAFWYILDLFNFGMKLPAISPSESGRQPGKQE